MPAGQGNEDPSKDNAAKRTTFRPPWVKDGGPNPLPIPTAAWVPKNARRDSNTSTDGRSDNPLANIQLRKTSITPKEPQENGSKENTFIKPSLKPVPPKPENREPREPKETKFAVKLNKVPAKLKKEATIKAPSFDEEPKREIDKFNLLVREESRRRVPPPVAPPMPPPPPPPQIPPDFKRDPLSRDQIEKLETLRARPKTRPDWTEMLKEIEGNKRLNHVTCNDRSMPVLPEAKAKEHFLYESEKDLAHNKLLNQIQEGIKLKKVKTNDRSKPQLEGLRKFRRQMTIEEQIQKSVSMASMPPEEVAEAIDEMDDIDKVRDDLQSTKQMLAFELRNKEAQERENKRLLAKIAALEAELEKEQTKEPEKCCSTTENTEQTVIKTLKEDATKAKKTSEEFERKLNKTSDELELTKSELTDVKKQKEELEKRIQDILQGKRHSASSCKLGNGPNESDEEAEEEESSDEDTDDEEKQEKRLQKQVKQLKNKIRTYKNKEDNARKERVALREIIKKHQQAMKDEKKKYKILQKEVDKMAAMMKDSSSDDDEEKEEPDEEEAEEEEESSEEETSEESESEESDESESERSQSEPEESPPQKKKENYTSRATRHENILSAIKKGNFMLKTNAERLQDELNKQKELTMALQEDLDSVLSELG